MLKRMKKVLKKEKGFTLVELLAVIVILGIILAIAVPSIGNVISSSKGDADKANKELMENAARLAHISDGTPDVSEYTLDTLVSDGFLEELPIDPNTDEEYTGKVTVAKKSNETENNGFSYKYEESD
ncbi:hypothetical protein CIL03_00870 [Virgibacillus indicus]|uniref:Prepilin-type cleavage/methylation domain-containing protein n=1 Tax=Virgibacillus indicus TaxID=2024554 RepID=A0A265ND74_9BACI|nr:type II secretion system protein [Virgibacillus indicus]OZU89725.1 hypothetical protein CIL03_00870 [Virgibacillus indicus]